MHYLYNFFVLSLFENSWFFTGTGKYHIKMTARLERPSLSNRVLLPAFVCRDRRPPRNGDSFEVGSSFLKVHCLRSVKTGTTAGAPRCELSLNRAWSRREQQYANMTSSGLMHSSDVPSLYSPVGAGMGENSGTWLGLTIGQRKAVYVRVRDDHRSNVCATTREVADPTPGHRCRETGAVLCACSGSILFRPSLERQVKRTKLFELQGRIVGIGYTFSGPASFLRCDK